MNYDYFKKRFEALKGIFIYGQKLGLETSPDNLVTDFLSLGFHLSLSDGKISEKQLATINDCLNTAISKDDIPSIQFDCENFLKCPMMSMTLTITMDKLLNETLTKTMLDVIVDFGYLVMCAEKEIEPLEEAYFNQYLEMSIVELGKHLPYKLEKPLPLSTLLCDNPELNPYKTKHIDNVTKEKIIYELSLQEIPTIPVFEYEEFGHPFYVALYPSNSIQGSAAIVSGKTLHLINLCNIRTEETVIDSYNDAQGVKDSLIAGVAGGAMLGSIVASVSQNHTIIREISCTLCDSTQNHKFKILFSKNEKFIGDEWMKAYAGARDFSDRLGNALNSLTNLEGMRNTSYSKYGREFELLSLNTLAVLGREPDDKLVDDNIKSAQQTTKNAMKNYEEKIEKEKRFRDYWKEHAEERLELKKELDSLYEKIKTLDKEKVGDDEIKAQTIKKRIEEMKKELLSFGLFKIKEKKILTSEISALENELNAINGKIQKTAKEKENAINGLKSRISYIEKELTRER